MQRRYQAGRYTRRWRSAAARTLAQGLPIVIEIVDAADKINAFLPIVDELVTEGMVTLDVVLVISTRRHRAEGDGGAMTAIPSAREGLLVLDGITIREYTPF